MCRNDKKERDPERVRVPSTEFIEKSNTYSELELRACSNQRLTGFVAFELSEVLDEAASQVFSLLFPLGSLSIRIARIEDLRIYARQFSRNYEVEVRDRLRRSLVNGAVQNGVDDAARIADRDTLAAAVPAGVHQVSLSAHFVHLLNQLFCILRRVQAQESCAEASGERRSGFRDATFRTGQLSREAGQEVVLSLLVVQDGYGRQYTEGIGRQEDYLMSVRTLRYGLHDVVDMIDRIRYAGVLRHALVSEVDYAVGVNRYILQQSIALDGVVDIGFTLLVEVDNLGIATALVVEHAFSVPSMFVLAEQCMEAMPRSGFR